MVPFPIRNTHGERLTLPFVDTVESLSGSRHHLKAIHKEKVLTIKLENSFLIFSFRMLLVTQTRGQPSCVLVLVY